MRFDAAVIGSGPAGATTARLLAQAGWSVALIERAGFPRRKVCGEFISAATMPVLEACGVADEFLGRAGPMVRTVAVYSGAAMVEAPLPYATSGWGQAMGREQLDVLLRDAAVAAGARLFQPVEVAALCIDEDGHQLTLAGRGAGHDIGARIVIGACGSWSRRGPFVITAGSRPSDLFAFKAHLHGAALLDGVMPLLAFPGGYGGMVHSDHGRLTLSCCIRRDALGRVREVYGGKAGEAVLRHISATTEGVRRALEGATIEGAILATGPIRPGIRGGYRDGMFFVGNAAGEAHPIIAEGISMAIQSAWLLAQGLAADGSAAGPIYARAWEQQFGRRLHAASAFAWLAINDRSRATAMRLIRAFPKVLTWGARLSGKAAPLRPHRLARVIGVRHDAA